MNKTPNYQLSQWAKSDRVLMDDFNADNAKLDAALTQKGNCQIVTGQYTGTGQNGINSPTSIPFSKKPIFLIVYGSGILFVPGGGGNAIRVTGGTSEANYASWTGSSLSWYCTRGPGYQMNDSGTTYYYLALFAQ